MRRCTVRAWGIVVCCVCALVLTACTSIPSQTTTSSQASKQQSSTRVVAEPVDEAFATGIHHARIEIEGKGVIEVVLNANVAPITVSNFCHLAQEGFYNGLTFHRIIQDFMMQGGDPKGDGTGGTDYDIKGEFKENGVANPLLHQRGAISMARAQHPDSASTQFFIMQKTNTSLDGKYAVFGNVTSGMEIVDDICNNTPVTDSNGTVQKGSEPKITRIDIVD